MVHEVYTNVQLDHVAVFNASLYASYSKVCWNFAFMC